MWKHKRTYKNKRILIFSDSQAALKALSGPKVTSELVADCLDALSALAGMNELTLAWVPGHCGILGNEVADKLARRLSTMPLPEAALGIPRCSARVAIGTWNVNQHHNAGRDLTSHRHGL
jgi:ribonuclease HI